MLAALCGALLGLLTVVKLLDTGFRSALGRPFNPVSDWRYAGSFVDLLGGSLGRAMAGVVGIGLAVLVVALLVTVPLAVRRLTRLAGRDRAVTYRFVGAFGAIWLVGATVGLQVAPGEPLAAADAAGLAYQQVATIRSGLADRSAFADQLAVPAASVPAALTRLQGKDVVFAFVESYGRVAVEDPRISPGVDAVLDNGTGQLTAAGFTSRSAFLTSPTFGGISWLAHSTVQSGRWVDSQQRYDQLMASDRPTLDLHLRSGRVADRAGRAGEHPRLAGRDLLLPGGPGVRLAHRRLPRPVVRRSRTPPDQYTLAQFQRAELAPADRAPVMAEIDLLTSHTPWVPAAGAGRLDADRRRDRVRRNARRGRRPSTTCGPTGTGCATPTARRSNTACPRSSRSC